MSPLVIQYRNARRGGRKGNRVTAAPSYAHAGKESDMAKQVLHLVFGRELKAGLVEFAGVGRRDIVGIYPDYKTAYAA